MKPFESSSRKMKGFFRQKLPKKRIAYLHGVVATSSRLVITGQLFDHSTTDGQLKEAWDPFLSLPVSLKNAIRPVSDIGISRSENVSIEIEIIRSDDENRRPLYRSSAVRSDANGAFHCNVGEEVTLPVGSYVASAYEIRNGRETDGGEPLGSVKIEILPDDYSGYIVTSDIDRTFLDTNLESTAGLLETLFETPEFKTPLPGMAEFYRQLLAGSDLPLYFISASPYFYRRTLLATFLHNGIDPAGLFLKPISDSLDSIVRKALFSIMNIENYLAEGIRKAFERSMKFLGSSMQSFFDQVAYKLTLLLKNRIVQPTGAKEILIGDNSESDYFIFSLYQILLQGGVRGEELVQYLYHLRFNEREAFTSDTARQIAALVEQNLAVHGKINSIDAIWINLAETEPDEYTMNRQIETSLPVVQREGAASRPVRAYCGSFELSLFALDTGILDLDKFGRIWNRLKNREEAPNQMTELARQLVESFPFQNVDAASLLAVIEAAG